MEIAIKITNSFANRFIVYSVNNIAKIGIFSKKSKLFEKNEVPHPLRGSELQVIFYFYIVSIFLEYANHNHICQDE